MGLGSRSTEQPLGQICRRTVRSGVPLRGLPDAINVHRILPYVRDDRERPYPSCRAIRPRPPPGRYQSQAKIRTEFLKRFAALLAKAAVAAGGDGEIGE
jgi:hypothetical protein